MKSSKSKESISGQIPMDQLAPFVEACKVNAVDELANLFGKCDANKRFKVLNSHDSLGMYLIHYAMQENSFTCVQLLLECGGDPNVADVKGDTPLHYAVRMSNAAYIELLILYCAELNRVNHAAKTAVQSYENGAALAAWIKQMSTSLLDDKWYESPYRLSSELRQEIRLCFECLDADSDGLVSYEDFVKFMKKSNSRTNKAQMDAFFGYFSKTGQLKFSDWLKYCIKLYALSNFSKSGSKQKQDEKKNLVIPVNVKRPSSSNLKSPNRSDSVSVPSFLSYNKIPAIPQQASLLPRVSRAFYEESIPEKLSVSISQAIENEAIALKSLPVPRGSTLNIPTHGRNGSVLSPLASPMSASGNTSQLATPSNQARNSITPSNQGRNSILSLDNPPKSPLAAN